LADVVTPNLPEAKVLLGRDLQGLEDMQNAARDLARYKSKSILIKGGHLDDDNSTDLLYLTREDQSIVLKEKKIETRNNHGTGCTLSSAIASYLAGGYDIESAVRKAKRYISEAIRAGSQYKLGHGHGPVHHFFQFWE